MSAAIKTALSRAEQSVDASLRRHGKFSKEYYVAVRELQCVVHKALSSGK